MQQIRPDMEMQQVVQLRGELRKVRDERDRAHRVLEVTDEWKSLASANDRTTIEALEAELRASRESEKRMLDSLALQTKQLELTKISLEEAKLEIASQREAVRRLESATPRTPLSTPRNRHDRDLQRVHGELRVALAAEEKSKKAMEEFVMALKEVNAELHTARQQLARAQHEAETGRLEVDRLHMSAKRKDERLRALSDEAARLRAEAEESFAAWRGKEAGFTACMKSTEAELAEARRENARLLESQRSWRGEVAKLRDILKQAVRDTKVATEALEEARAENALLRTMLGDKDTAVKRTKQELECLRMSEAAARDSVKELQSMLVATSASPTAAAAAAAGKPDLEESPSPRAIRVGPPGLEKYPSDSKIRPPAGITRPRRLSETFEGSAYDIFGSMDDQKGDLSVFSGMPRLPGRRRVVLRKVGSLFRWKSFTNK
jgi:chromosome segregation ATPase